MPAWDSEIDGKLEVRPPTEESVAAKELTAALPPKAAASGEPYRPTLNEDDGESEGLDPVPTYESRAALREREEADWKAPLNPF